MTRSSSKSTGLLTLAVLCFAASTAILVTAITFREPFVTIACVPLVALGVVIMGRAVRARGSGPSMPT